MGLDEFWLKTMNATAADKLQWADRFNQLVK